MVLLKLLLFTLTFYELIVDLDAIPCQKGQRINSKGKCEACPDDYYQNVENPTHICRPCKKCDEKHGSVVKQKCTKVKDTECECRSGFVVRGMDPSTCKCEIGFGLKNGECLQCEEGYFNPEINKGCKKWRECNSGVKVNGTRISDVICHHESERNPNVTPPHIPCSASNCPHEDSPHQTEHTTTTAAPPAHTVTTKCTPAMTPIPPSNISNHIGMVFLMVGIFGILILTAVTCKLHMCVWGKSEMPTKDSYRRPVEESGGDGSLSSLKQNPGEH